MSPRTQEEFRQHAELMELLSQVSRTALEEDDLELLLKNDRDFHLGSGCRSRSPASPSSTSRGSDSTPRSTPATC